MGDKLNAILIWTAIVAVSLGILFFIFQPLIFGYAEWVLYVRISIVLFAISTFAQLRLYNSIVQNTRFSIKLREAIVSFIRTVPVLERSMKNLNSTMGNVKASSDALRKSMDKNSETK